MATSPQISVVVPVYNGEKDLRACLASIAAAVARVPASRTEALEVIVCDNWSSDTSGSIAREFSFGCPSRVVQPVRHEDNRTHNWRAGLAHASAAWAMMLHADDLMAEGALRSLLDAVARTEARSAALVVGRHRTFEDESSLSSLHPRWRLPALVDGPRLAREVLPFHCPFVPFVLFRRALYEQLGGLDPRWELVQDWELWMRMVMQGDVYFTPVEVGAWRLHDSGAKYKRMNAREHVQLADVVQDSVGVLPARHVATARRVALARAVVHLHSAGADPAAEPWLDGQELPTPQAAEVTLRRIHRRAAASQVVLRAWGFPRWAHRHVKPAEPRSAPA